MTIECSELKINPFKFKHKVNIYSDCHCSGDIYSISKGESVMVLSAGQFSFSDVIENIIDQIGICDLYISTWTASHEGMRKAFDFLSSNRIRNVKFLIDRGFKQFRGKAYDFLISKFSEDCIRTTRIHAKFALICNDDHKITIRTSANLNKNIRSELFEVTNDKKMADFFLSFFDIAWAKIKTSDNFELSSSHKLNSLIEGIDKPMTTDIDKFKPEWL